MSDLSFNVTVDDKQVADLFARAPAAFVRTLTQLVEGGAIDTQRYTMQVASIAVTGQLRGSIRYTMHVGDTVWAEVGPEADYAADVEYGTKPHAVSAAPGSSLAQWAEQKGINPHAVATSIMLRGTQPHPFIQPTYDVMQDPVSINIRNGVNKFAEALNNGQA